MGKIRMDADEQCLFDIYWILECLLLVMFVGKIFEHQLRQAETTQCVRQAVLSVRPLTQSHLAAPEVPLRKLSSSTPNLTLIPDSDQSLGSQQVSH